MKNLKSMWCYCKCSPDFGLLALRIAVALVFVTKGWGKLGNIEMVSGMLDNMGFFWPMFWAWVLGLVEFVGGLMVLFGLFTKTAAGFLSITMIVALLSAHLGKPLDSAMLAITLLGANLALHSLGAGKYRIMSSKIESVCGNKGKTK